MRQRDRRVVDDAVGGKSVLKGCQIDKGLERRAWLPFGLGYPVELAHTEIPTADHRQNAPILRVHSYKTAADIGDLPQAVSGDRRGGRSGGALVVADGSRGGGRRRTDRLDKDDVAHGQHVMRRTHKSAELLIRPGLARPGQLAHRDASLIAAIERDIGAAGIERSHRRYLPGVDTRPLGHGGKGRNRRRSGRSMADGAAPAVPTIVGDQPVVIGAFGHRLITGRIAGSDREAALIQGLFAKANIQLAPDVLGEIAIMLGILFLTQVDAERLGDCRFCLRRRKPADLGHP